MNILQRINALFFTPGRTFWGSRIDPESYWDQVERAHLLLDRLKDPDLNWAQPSVYLRGLSKFYFDMSSRDRDGELEALLRLYTTWVSISKEVNSFPDYEIDHWWLYKLEAAGSQIVNCVLPLVHPVDSDIFHAELPNIHRCINNNIIYDTCRPRSSYDYLAITK